MTNAMLKLVTITTYSKLAPLRTAAVVTSTALLLFLLLTDGHLHWTAKNTFKVEVGTTTFNVYNQFNKAGRQSTVKNRNGFHKLVHLDLKGAPPLFSYLLELLPLFRQLGATGLLVEYEDMFPYEGLLRNVRKPYAYTSEQIKIFLSKAKENDLEVIPLVQTLGHLEFVLKNWKFLHLREVYNDDRSICPSNNISVDVLQEMIDNILSLHPDAKWIHLGGDEVVHLMVCRRCQLTVTSKERLYVDHMTKLMRHVTDRTGGSVRAIVWDDMMRSFSNQSIERMSKHGDTMIWSYNGEVDDDLGMTLLQTYAGFFENIWVASAFKGATRQDTNFVDIKPRLRNNRSWRLTVRRLTSLGYHVQGVALTGWSKFTHHSKLCELLPSGIPSLALCLGEWQSYEQRRTGLLEKISKNLGFKDNIILSPPETVNSSFFQKASFPGSEIYTTVAILESMYSMQRNLEFLFRCFNLKLNVTACRLETLYFPKLLRMADDLDIEMMNFGNTAGNLLSKYFHEVSVEQWIWEKVTLQRETFKHFVKMSPSLMPPTSL